MAITAGVLSQVAVTDKTASLSATAATGGTGPYTYQWYKSTQSGFSPGGGNIIAGATDLALEDDGLIPNTLYYYKLIATDTGHSNDEVTYTQLAVTTANQTLSQNQFAQSEYLGTVDQALSTNTHPVQIDVSQATPLFAGAAVKVVDSAYGIPKVVGCTAQDDECIGFINFDVKSPSFPAASLAEVSMESNVIYLYATEAIARFAKVCLDISTMGGVQSAASASVGDTIVGFAYDKAVGAGDLIRVYVGAPYYFGKVPA